MSDALREKVKKLSCWQGTVEVQPLSGGMTNVNFKVTDDVRSYVVRMGGDIPEHLVMRSNEIAAARAASDLGLSPDLVHIEPGVLVMHFIEGRVYDAADVQEPGNLARIIRLVKRFHREMPGVFNGYPVIFWVFQVLRHYRNLLERENSPHLSRIPGFMKIAEDLERTVGPVEIGFGHNDLLSANFIDDGGAVWLIDFDYAGFNSPLFDLANLASNNELSAEQEKSMLAQYFESPASDGQWRSYCAMKCASLLRETMWSMVSEATSVIDFDYSQYTAENLERFERVYLEYRKEFN